MNIETVTWVDVDEQLRRTRRALIPVGAVEVYGPHLPQGTDGLTAAAICGEVGRRTGCFVAPLIPVGWSESLAGFPGTLSVPPETVRAYCDALVTSMFRWGVEAIVLLNAHLGNVACLTDLCLEHDRPAAGRRLVQIDLWRYIQPFTADVLRSPSWKFGHAGECMTAVMLHLRPDLVRTERVGRFLPDGIGAAPGALVPRRYRDQAPDGFVGDATLATAETGREIVERCVAHLIEFMDHEFGPLRLRAEAGGA